MLLETATSLKYLFFFCTVFLLIDDTAFEILKVKNKVDQFSYEEHLRHGFICSCFFLTFFLVYCYIISPFLQLLHLWRILNTCFEWLWSNHSSDSSTGERGPVLIYIYGRR